MSKAETDYQGVPQSESQSTPPPPSYNSLNFVTQLKAVNDIKDPKDRITAAISIIFGSILTTVALALMSALPLSQLVIGVFNKEKCQIEPKIPLWLIVSGAGGLVLAFLKVISNIIVIIKRRKNPESTEPVVLNCFSCCGSIFLLVWFILGNIWVYSKWNTVQYSSTLDPYHYCDKLTYLFAFWSITATYIIIGIFCMCICGVCCLGWGAVCCLVNS